MKNLSIRVKIAFGAMLCMIVMGSILTFMASQSTRTEAEASAKFQVESDGRIVARWIRANLETAYNVSKTMNNILTEVKNQENPLELNRDQTNKILQSIVKSNKKVLGIYTIWEPNQFDGLDAEFVGKPGHDATGRFVPYWVRSGNEIKLEANVDYEVEGPGDYYQIPKKTKKDVLINPYIYKVDGKDVMMTSLVSPIIVNDVFYGITGADVALTFLKEVIDTTKVFDGHSEISVITYVGDIAAATHTNDAVISKKASLIIPEFETEKYLTKIQAGELFYSQTKDSLRVFSPVKVGKISTPWTICITVPLAKVTEKADAIVKKQVIMAIFLISIAVIGFYFLIGKITLNIQNVANAAKQLARGDLNISLKYENKDEIGEMVSAFTSMVETQKILIQEMEEVNISQSKGEVDRLIDIEKFEGAYKQMAIGINTTIDNNISTIFKILDVLEAYSENRFDTKLDILPGKLSKANLSMDLLKKNLTNLIQEIDLLVVTFADGNLSHRANTENVDGVFKDVLSGINSTLLTLVTAINHTQNVLEQISIGIIPEQTNETNKGDYDKFRVAFNKLFDSLQLFVKQMKMMAENHRNGIIKSRIDADKFQGVFSEMANGINSMMDETLSIQSSAMNVVNSYAKGDFAVKLEIMPGERVEINNILDNVKDNLLALKNEIGDSINYIQNGNLEYRSDVNQFVGDWQVIIKNMNNLFESITQPFSESAMVLGYMANGDFSHRMYGEYKGEFHTFKENVNYLAESMSDLLSQLKVNIETTSSTSAELSSTSDMMASSLQEQSAQLAEVASSVQQMSFTISENSRSVNTTLTVANFNGEIAKQGGLIVEQTINKMKDIATVVAKSGDKIKELGQSSEKIGEIVEVINDIADQTNLLALNAAIEAARAGEHGRGFSVVADEVRKLAERTTVATKEIGAMIKSIQEETLEAVQAMNLGTIEVNNGISLADNAGNSLQEIMHSSKELSDHIYQIASASEEQAATSEQISVVVSSISKVTSDTVEQIEEVAKAADGLTRQTENLNYMVSKFKIDQNEKNNNFLTNNKSKRLN